MTPKVITSLSGRKMYFRDALSIKVLKAFGRGDFAVDLGGAVKNLVQDRTVVFDSVHG